MLGRNTRSRCTRLPDHVPVSRDAKRITRRNSLSRHLDTRNAGRRTLATLRSLFPKLLPIRRRFTPNALRPNRGRPTPALTSRNTIILHPSRSQPSGQHSAPLRARNQSFLNPNNRRRSNNIRKRLQSPPHHPVHPDSDLQKHILHPRPLGSETASNIRNPLRGIHQSDSLLPHALLADETKKSLWARAVVRRSRGRGARYLCRGGREPQPNVFRRRGSRTCVKCPSKISTAFVVDKATCCVVRGRRRGGCEKGVCRVYEE